MVEEIRSYKGKTLFLAILCIVANLSYYPVFVENGMGRKVNIAMWVLLGIRILYDNRITLGSTLLKSYSILFGFFVFNSLVISYVTDENAFKNHFFQPVTIAFVIFFCAYTIGYEIDKNKLIKVCEVYFYSMLIISIFLFFNYLQKTDLTSKIYGYSYGKNEISVLLLCGLVIACTVYNADTSVKKALRLIGIMFFTVDILYLRCRSVMIGVVILAVMLTFSSKSLKKSFQLLIILAIAATVIFFVLNPAKFDYFMDNIVYAGRDANDVNDLSSGRSDQVNYGMSVFDTHEWFGVGALHDTIDCFYVSALVNYGLMGWPVMIMAVVPFIWGTIQLKNKEPIYLCFFVISASLFAISWLEELAPFGPGTRSYLMWLMWGILARHRRLEFLRTSG